MSPHNLVICVTCERAFQKEDLEKHQALHNQEGDICILCGLGIMQESEDKKRVTCPECSTTWVKKGHEKPLSERI